MEEAYIYDTVRSPRGRGKKGSLNELTAVALSAKILKEGDIINVEIESMSEDKELGFADEQQSGKYLILHLCHHFDSQRSFTSMTLARDTYGLHTGK